MQWKQAALLLSWAFYGLDELAGGFLIFRSRFLPRILGILLGIAGLCYSRMAFSASCAVAGCPVESLHLLCLSAGEALTSLWMAT